MTLLGAILAGGQSQRFGSDKALAPLDGRPLIDHAAALLAPHVDALIICGRREYPGPVTCIADQPAPHLGPLGGLCAALCHAQKTGHDAVLSVGCDTPELPAGLLARLVTAGPGVHVADMPVIGLWPSTLAAVLEDHLNVGGDRSVRRWARSIGAGTIRADGHIPNLNAPADLDRLRRSRPI